MFASENESRDSDMALWPWEEDKDSEWFSPQPFAADGRSKEHDEERAAKAVIHPFGRGKFRTVAEHVVIPPIVVDAILKGKGRDSPWTWPAEPADQRPAPKPERALGRGTKWKPKHKWPKWTGQMGGVKSAAPSPPSYGSGGGISRSLVGGATKTSPQSKPKLSGRGRALKMRAERYGIPLRKPGGLVSPYCNYPSSVFLFRDGRG